MEEQAAEEHLPLHPLRRHHLESESHSQGATVDENQGLIYRTRLSLEKNTLIVDGRQTQLMLGIAVTAEITTGKRRLIEFFLAPLLRAKQESLRER